MAWDDIINDPEFQAQPQEAKVKVAENYFAQNIAAASDFQAQAPDVQNQVRTNFLKTIAPAPSEVGVSEALARGVYGGVRRRIPEMVGQALEFTGIAPETGAKIKEFAREGEVRPEYTGAVSKAFGEAGEMLPASIGLTLGLTGLGKAVVAVPHPYARVAGAALQIAGTYGVPALFGLAQARSTEEIAEERGIEPGAAPYITGAIEAGGETLGTLALTRLLGPLAPLAEAGAVSVKSIIKPTLGRVLKEAPKTFATELATEFGQQYGQAAVEKAYGIREEAEPLAEAVGVLAPTAIMTAFGMGGAKLASIKSERMLTKALSDPTVDKERRAAAVVYVGKNIEQAATPELAEMWTLRALQSIDNKEAIDIDADIKTVSAVARPGDIAEKFVADIVAEGSLDDATGKAAVARFNELSKDDATPDDSAELLGTVLREAGFDIETMSPIAPAEEALPEAEVIPEVVRVRPTRVRTTPEGEVTYEYPEQKLRAARPLREAELPPAQTIEERRVVAAETVKTRAVEALADIEPRTEMGAQIKAMVEEEVAKVETVAPEVVPEVVPEVAPKAAPEAAVPTAERIAEPSLPAAAPPVTEPTPIVEPTRRQQLETLREQVTDQTVLKAIERELAGKKLTKTQQGLIDAALAPTEEAAPKTVELPFQRVRIGTSPQGYEVLSELEATPEEKALGERYFEIRNEKTGEVSTVEFGEMKPVKAKAPKTIPLKRREAPYLAEGLPGVKAVPLRADIEAVVDILTKTWDNAPPINTVSRVNQLPSHLHDYVMLKKGEKDVEGIFDPETKAIYLIAENIDSVQRAKEVLFHEALGHYGMRGLLGKDITPVLNQVYIKYRKEAQKIAKQYDFDVSAAEGRRQAAEEHLANMAQTNQDPKLLAKAIAVIRNWLRKAGFDIKLSDNDIRAMLADAAAFTREGRKPLSYTGLAAFAKRAPAPIYFSKLQETIGDKMARRASVDTVRGLIKDVKAEEVKWSGIEDFLEGKTHVDKDELLAFLQLNEIEIVEVEKRDKADISKFRAEKAAADGVWLVFKGAEFQASVRAETANEAITEIASKPETKHSKYQLPGGENYKELLLTLPVADLRPRRATRTADEIWAEREERARQMGLDVGLTGGMSEFADLEAEFEESQRETKSLVGEKSRAETEMARRTFKSSHWDEPNVLAHIRFNERTDADGNKVLFLEEVQSDWALEARKKGIGEKVDIRRDQNGFYRAYDAAGEQIELRRGGEVFSAMATEQAVRDALPASFFEKGVPDAPFLTGNKWTELALKRMLRYASENGFDKMAWISGEQTAGRYDLSKQVDAINYSKNPDGSITIATVRNGVEDQYINTDAAGLERYVGKDIANRIFEASEDIGSLEGQDLKVGGEWAFTLYDKVIPNFLKKYGKKWGAEVGEVKADDIEYGRETAPQRKYLAEEFSLQQSITITPEMKAAVLEGRQPMFARKPVPGGRIEELRELFEAGPMPLRETEEVYGVDKKAMEHTAKDIQSDFKNSNEAKHYIQEAAEGRGGFIAKAKDAIERLSPLGKLPEVESYLKMRYQTMGKIAKIDEISRTVYETFKNASTEEAATIYKYLTDKTISPNSIENAKLRSDAVKVKNMMIRTGQQLVNRKLLKPETFEAMKGAYLPHIYLRHLLPNDVFTTLSAGKKPSDMGWAKKRKDIPLEVRTLIFGQIFDPGFLAAKGFGVQQRDMAILDWLGEIAKNRKWVTDKALVEWQGRPVTAFWLASEAEQIRKQAVHYTPENKAAALKIVAEMHAIVDALPEDYKVTAEGYKRFPDTARYGALRGLAVRREIYDDILGASTLHTGDVSVAEQILGNGGYATKFTQLWKWMKVAANPPGQVRNFISNGILLHLSGVSFHKIPRRVIEAIRDIRQNGKYWQAAKKYGVTESTFSAQELGRIERELLDIEAKKAGTVNLATLRNIAGKIMDFTGDMYQMSESIFKTAKIIDEMKKGKSADDAALEAQKWLFDYSLITPSMRYLRNAPIGAPFLTFYLKALPRMVEVMATRPWVFAPYIALPFILTQLIAQMTDVDDDDVDKLRKALPKWLEEKGHAYILPAKDDKGRWTAIDVGYFYPWATWSNLAADLGKGEIDQVLLDTGLFGGPVTNMIAALQTNRDPFTQRDIVNKYDPPAKKIASIMGYLYQTAAPTWLTDIGWAGHMYRALSGTVDKYGEEKTNVTQANMRLLGVNLYPIDPMRTRATNIRWMRFEISETKKRRNALLKDRNLTAKERKDIVKEYQVLIARRSKELQDYVKASQVHPRLR